MVVVMQARDDGLADSTRAITNQGVPNLVWMPKKDKISGEILLHMKKENAFFLQVN